MRNAIGNAELIKTVNTSIILDIIRKNKYISRVKIANISKLNPSTVSNLTGELIKVGILKEVGTGISQKGRRPIQLSLNPDGPCIIGVEVIGDRIVALIVNMEAKIIAKAMLNINSVTDGEAVVKKIIKTVHKVIKKSGKHKNEIKGIGMGITGLIDPEAGIAKFSPNIDWKNTPIKKSMEEEFEIQTFVDNDVKAMALGESRFGSAKEVRNLICINIGKGLGSGIIINREIHRGANWIAGEIGHISIDLNGPRCTCGNRGCLEIFASGRGMISRALEAIEEGSKTLIAQLVSNRLDKITPKTIFEAADMEDKLANQIIKEAGRYLGVAIANIINTFDPEVVILGGEIVQIDNFDLMLKSAKQTVFKHVFGGKTRKTEISTTDLGDNSPAIGAATLVVEKLFNPLSL